MPTTRLYPDEDLYQEAYRLWLEGSRHRRARSQLAILASRIIGERSQ